MYKSKETMYYDVMISCKECGHECSAANALGYHLRSHGMTYCDYVVKHDYNGVWPTCKCGKKLDLKKGGFGTFCSRSCSSSGEDNPMGRMKGTASPNYGQKRTEEQRKNYSTGAKKRWEVHGDKLRTMMKTPEYRESQKEANLKSYASSDRAQRVSKSVNRFWSSGSDVAKQRRKEASDRAIVLLSENKIGPRAPFKTCWHDNPFTGKEEFMHSSWETTFLSACITEGYPVTKEHDIRIPYVGTDGEEHAYIPDFMSIGGDQTLFEIKGRQTETDDLKHEAAREWCAENGFEFVVLGTV